MYEGQKNLQKIPPLVVICVILERITSIPALRSYKQGTHSYCIFKFPVFSRFFPVRPQIFRCANLRDL